MIVRPHRDLVAQFGSYLSLGGQTRRISTDRPQRLKDTQINLHITRVAMRKSNDAAAMQAGSLCNVKYKVLVSGSTATDRNIYEHFGICLTPDTQDRIAAHVETNRKGKHGRHTYDLKDYALTADQVLDAFRT
jgi:hypothetical protein